MRSLRTCRPDPINRVTTNRCLTGRRVQPGVEPAAPDAETAARIPAGAFNVETGQLRIARGGNADVYTFASVVGPISLVPIVSAQVVPLLHAGGDGALEGGKLERVTGTPSDVSRIVSPLIFVDRIALSETITGSNRFTTDSQRSEYELSPLQVITSDCRMKRIESRIGKPACLPLATPTEIVQPSQIVPTAVELRHVLGEFELNVVALVEFALDAMEFRSSR